MSGIVITGIVLFVLYLIRQNSIENKRQEERKKQQLLDEQKRKQEEERKRKAEEERKKQQLLDEQKRKQDEEIKRKAEAERKRLEELNYENPIVVFASVDDNGKPKAILKRSDNTYISVERVSENSEPYTIGEKLRLSKETINKWSWYGETEYRRQLGIKERYELERQKKIQEQNEKVNFLKSFGIDYLYHMTHKNNLQNILQNGLLSHNQARNSRLTQVDIADNQVNDRRLRNEPIYQKSIHDYVPLYFNPKNPMLYRRGNIQNEIIILAIDSNLLYQSNTVFTNGNAAAGATSFFSNPNDLTKLNWTCINAEYWNDIVDGKRIKCSEVLVFPSIPTNAIKKIFCNNQQTKQFVTSSLTNHNFIEVEIYQNLYFSGFVQQNINYQNNQPPTNNTTNDPLDDLPF